MSSVEPDELDDRDERVDAGDGVDDDVIGVPINPSINLPISISY
jgi:hypothetical protein